MQPLYSSPAVIVNPLNLEILKSTTELVSASSVQIHAGVHFPIKMGSKMRPQLTAGSCRTTIRTYRLNNTCLLYESATREPSISVARHLLHCTY